jgi:hypothetical protein
MSEPNGWLSLQRDSVELRCVYCGNAGAFPHQVSFMFGGLPWHLHRCPQCDSLIYDQANIFARPANNPITDGEYEIHAKHYLEVGYNIDYLVLCALLAFGDVPEEQARGRIFFDVGAGMGLGTYFVSEMFGTDVLAIEPSFTGRIGQRIFNIDLRPDHFEELGPEVMQRLRSKPCLVHLNSVVEHLVDPRVTLEALIADIEVETLAIVVPNAADATASFLHALPTLSPPEHLHLPTSDGMVRLLEHLGFAHHAVEPMGSLLIALGGRQPVSIPSHQAMKPVRDRFLERLLHHAHPHVAHGAAARLLPEAVNFQQQALLACLRQSFGDKLKPQELLTWLRYDADFDRIPFHLAPTCYWLAVDAVSQAQFGAALEMLDVVEAFANRIAAQYPQYSEQPQQYKWLARLYRSDVLRATGRNVEADVVLAGVIASASDTMGGASVDHVRQAREHLGH